MGGLTYSYLTQSLTRLQRVGRTLTDYRVLTFDPTIVGDFVCDEYLTQSGGSGPFSSVFSFSRPDPATMNDADGNFVTVPANTPRIGHHVYSGSAYVNRGLLLNPVPVTNLLEYALGSATNWSAVGGTVLTDLSLNALDLFPGVRVASSGVAFHRIQGSSISLTAGTTHGVTVYYRAGSSGQCRVTMRNSTAATSTTLFGAAGLLSVAEATAGAVQILRQVELPDSTFELKLSFTAAASGVFRIGIGPNSATAGEDMVFLGAQVDSIGIPTQLIVSNGSPETRGADSLSIAPAVLQANGLTGSVAAYSIAMSGQVLYADDDSFATVRPLRISGTDANNFVSWQIDTAGALEGRLVQNQRQGGVNSFITVTGVYEPNETQSFNIASRHTASEHQIAYQGTVSAAATANGLPSPSASAMQFFDLGSEATVELVRVYPEDVTSAGIDEASTQRSLCALPDGGPGFN